MAKLPDLSGQGAKAKLFLQTHNPLRRLYGSLARRPLRIPNRQPLISFTFDDFLTSAYGNGGAILKEHDLRGTYYMALGLMGTAGPLGQLFSEKDLRGVVADGHELACHSFGHLLARKIPYSVFSEDVLRNQEALRRILPSIRLRNFSYPFGHITFAAKRRLVDRFRSLRSVYSGINAGRTDLSMVLANRLYSNVVPLNSVDSLIERNARAGGWLVFYTHDVSPKPSAGGCTPEFLRTTVRSALRSDARILPVDKALDVLMGSDEPLESSSADQTDT